MIHFFVIFDVCFLHWIFENYLYQLISINYLLDIARWPDIWFHAVYNLTHITLFIVIWWFWLLIANHYVYNIIIYCLCVLLFNVINLLRVWVYVLLVLYLQFVLLNLLISFISPFIIQAFSIIDVLLRFYCILVGHLLSHVLSKSTMKVIICILFLDFLLQLCVIRLVITLMIGIIFT